MSPSGDHAAASGRANSGRSPLPGPGDSQQRLGRGPGAGPAGTERSLQPEQQRDQHAQDDDEHDEHARAAARFGPASRARRCRSESEPRPVLPTAAGRERLGRSLRHSPFPTCLWHPAAVQSSGNTLRSAPPADGPGCVAALELVARRAEEAQVGAATGATGTTSNASTRRRPGLRANRCRAARTGSASRAGRGRSRRRACRPSRSPCRGAGSGSTDAPSPWKFVVHADGDVGGGGRTAGAERSGDPAGGVGARRQRAVVAPQAERGRRPPTCHQRSSACPDRRTEWSRRMCAARDSCHTRGVIPSRPSRRRAGRDACQSPDRRGGPRCRWLAPEKTPVVWQPRQRSSAE